MKPRLIHFPSTFSICPTFFSTLPGVVFPESLTEVVELLFTCKSAPGTRIFVPEQVG
jgi:hypothetical protein